MSYTKKQFEDLDLMDNFLMDAVASDPDVGELACGNIISALLQKKIGRVRVVSQRVLVPVSPEHRGIRMDVEVEESGEAEGELPGINIYDLEPHRKAANQENLPRRTRFYQAKIDSRRLKSGEKNFRKLPNLYIMNILDYDPFGYGQMCYTIENKCVEEPELLYDDGLKILYFVTCGTKGGSASIQNMLRFMHDSSEENAVDDTTRKLYDYVRQVKIQTEARERYMSWDEMFDQDMEEAWEKGRREGRREGRQEGRQEGSVRRLIYQIAAKHRKDKTLEEIADDLEEEVEAIQEIYDIIVKCGMESSEDQIYEAYCKEKEAVLN